MCSLNQSIIGTTLNVELNAEAKALHVLRMSEEDLRRYFGVLGKLFLVCTGCDKLECAEETCCERNPSSS